MRDDKVFKYFCISIFCIWITVFALLPYCLVFLVSFMANDKNLILSFHFGLNHYTDIFNSLYLRIFFKSFYIAGICTAICLVIAYPFAFTLTRVPERYKNFLMLLVIIPFWTSSLVRSYAMMTIVKAKGLLNTILLGLGIIHHPFQLLFTNTAVIIGLVYNLLPFMVLPLFANIEKLDFNLVEAAMDLGANKYKCFTKVIFPLTLPGIVAGCILVFLPAMTIFYIPDLLGGAKSLLLGNLIENQFLITQNWPLGSAISILLTLVMGVLMWIYHRSNKYQNGHELYE